MYFFVQSTKLFLQRNKDCSTFVVTEGTKMDLEEYDKKVGTHLDFIRHGTEMVVRHISHLEERPDFITLAEDELAQGISLIEESLDRLREAHKNYLSKPVIPE